MFEQNINFLKITRHKQKRTYDKTGAWRAGSTSAWRNSANGIIFPCYHSKNLIYTVNENSKETDTN